MEEITHPEIPIIKNRSIEIAVTCASGVKYVSGLCQEDSRSDKREKIKLSLFNTGSLNKYYQNKFLEQFTNPYPIIGISYRVEKLTCIKLRTNLKDKDPKLKVRR